MFNTNFITDESGAVTVDWVVLTAALVGLGLAVMAVISTGLENLSTDVQEQMSDGSIIRTSFTGGSVAGATAACGIATCTNVTPFGDLSGLNTTDLTTEADGWGDWTTSDRAAGVLSDNDYSVVDGTLTDDLGDAVTGAALDTYTQAAADDATATAYRTEINARAN